MANPGQDPRQESGRPGGGQGRTDEVGRSGVYPGSGPYPEGREAELKTPESFVHGQRNEQGREVEGGSEPIKTGSDSVIGGATPPPSGPPKEPSK